MKQASAMDDRGGSGRAAAHAALALAVGSTAIFLASMALSFAVAYDQPAARAKFTLMLSGLVLPLALAAFARGRLETVLGVSGMVCAFVAADLSVSMWGIKIVDQDSVAASLIVLVPLGGCGLIWAWARQARVLVGLLGVSLAVAVIAVAISGENSAWIGLAAGGALGLYAYWRSGVRSPGWAVRFTDGMMLAGGVLFLLVYAGMILAPDGLALRLGDLLPAYFQNRLFVWRDALVAVQDYLFTGSGLGNASMVLSSYVFLLHVPFMYHVHNLLLQMAVEQGIAGVIGFLGMSIASIWMLVITLRDGVDRFRPYVTCILVAVIALLVAGLFESDIYAGVLVLLLYVPFGFAWVLGQYAVVQRAGDGASDPQVRVRDLMVGLLPVGLLFLLMLFFGAQAQLRANLGALAQTHAELSVFQGSHWSIQDELRRSPAVDLAPATAQYLAALQMNPSNVTAHRRLGQIALSVGDLGSARQHLEAAYAAAPDQRTTRQLLGEVYAVDGEIDRAAALWKTVNRSQQQLEERHWWYTELGEQTAAQRVRAAIDRIMN